MSAYHQKWYRRNKKKCRRLGDAYYKKHKKERSIYAAANNIDIKLKTLSRYGFNGKLQCCWPDCRVNDIDMLSLDHIYNNGREDRKNWKSPAGVNFYRRLIKKGFPEGFQTLCLNHQSKKELMRRREVRIGELQ